MNLPVKKKKMIQTQRLQLKPYEQKDLNRIMELLTNEEITKTFMVPDFTSESEVAALAEKIIGFGQIDDTTHLDYGIYLNDFLIGFVNNCDLEEDEIEIGYVIHPDYKGHGYATEAVKAIIQELKEMGFHKVTAGYFEENPASRRIMEKCGMHPIDLVEEDTYRGKVHRCLYCECIFN